MILRDMLLHIWTRGPLITIQRELVTMLRCEKIDRLLTGKIIRSSRRPRDIFRSRDRSRRESYRRDITRYFKKMHVIKHFCLTIEWIWWRGEPGRQLHHAWETKRIAIDGRCSPFCFRSLWSKFGNLSCEFPGTHVVLMRPWISLILRQEG